MDNLIYLDNAATAWPKPENVYSFMIDFYRKYGVNPGRSGFDLAIEAGNILEQLRQRLTKFFGGDEDAPERLCFGYNATDALNLIIQGLLGPGASMGTRSPTTSRGNTPWLPLGPRKSQTSIPFKWS